MPLMLLLVDTWTIANHFSGVFQNPIYSEDSATRTCILYKYICWSHFHSQDIIFVDYPKQSYAYRSLYQPV